MLLFLAPSLNLMSMRFIQVSVTDVVFIAVFHFFNTGSKHLLCAKHCPRGLGLTKQQKR